MLAVLAEMEAVKSMTKLVRVGGNGIEKDNVEVRDWINDKD